MDEDVTLSQFNTIVSRHAGNARFDAAQYAFFGGDVPEEVELGGLEDDGDAELAGFDDEEFRFSSFEAREDVSY